MWSICFKSQVLKKVLYKSEDSKYKNVLKRHRWLELNRLTNVRPGSEL